MSKAKATHRGTCQACGALQKLPDNRLSTHGYTVKWNCFNGICQGTGHPPFEISKDLIESCIVSAELRITQVQAEQARIRSLVAPTAIVSYSDAAGYKHRHETEIRHEQKEVKGLGHAFHVFTYVDFRKQTRKIERFQFSSFPSSLEIACRELNEKAAATLESSIRELREYIKWQQGRIANWKPTPENLKPIKP